LSFYAAFFYERINDDDDNDDISRQIHTTARQFITRAREPKSYSSRLAFAAATALAARADLFSFARWFWNQIFTCSSLTSSCLASSDRRPLVR